MEDLVHLVEDFGEGGLEVNPLAHVRRPACGMLYANDAGVVCKSKKHLAKMTVIVTVFESAGLTVCETKKETTLPRTLNKVLPAPPLVIEAAGQRYICRRCIFCAWAPSYKRKRRPYAINERRIRLAWACYDRFKRDILRSFQA